MSLSASQLIERFRQILGWPYRAGGTDETGIDCSGAFVRAFRQSGLSIYHGSNRILRRHCTGVRRIGDGGALRPGMAVFKERSDLSQLAAAYQPGGKYYDPAWPLDYYHIGLVESVRPLHILHATTPVAKRDTKLGAWAVQGWLTGVTEEAGDTEAQGAGATNTAEDGAAQAVTIGYIAAESGSTVNLRAKSSKQSAILRRLPIGTCVRVLRTSGDWARVSDGTLSGYVMAQFLATDKGAGGGQEGVGGAQAGTGAASPTQGEWQALLSRLAALETRVAQWTTKEENQ